MRFPSIHRTWRPDLSQPFHCFCRKRRRWIHPRWHGTTDPVMQWRRSVVKYGGQGQSGQAIKRSDASKKIVLPSMFDTSLSSFMVCETCKVIQQQFWMKECDILGGQNILWTLLHILGGKVPQNPRIYAPGFSQPSAPRTNTSTASFHVTFALRFSSECNLRRIRWIHKSDEIAQKIGSIAEHQVQTEERYETCNKITSATITRSLGATHSSNKSKPTPAEWSDDRHAIEYLRNDTRYRAIVTTERQ